jgi:hypothetical protein
MQRRNWFLTGLRCLICLLLIVPALFTGPPPSAEARQLQQPSNYAVHFLPNFFSRLCVGDSHRYSFWVKRIEPEEYEPVPVDEFGNFLRIPLIGYTARVSATHGIVEPAEFYSDTPQRVFTFKYTAQREGPENIQVTIEDGATGQAIKNLQILGTCNYDLYFFAKERQTDGPGGFEAVFNGSGDFSLDRTGAGANFVRGNGTDRVSLGLWATSPGLFLCTMNPIRTSGTFNIEGTLHPEEERMKISLKFNPIKFSGSMHFDCSALGFDSLVFDFPVKEQVGDPGKLKMNDMKFPITGGASRHSCGGMSCMVVVKLKK